MKTHSLLISAFLAACSAQPNGANESFNRNAASNNVENATDPSVLDTPSGKYRVQYDSNFKNSGLPSNADLKMVDNDLARYAVKLCGLDLGSENSSKICKLFVQPDITGLLIGYAALQQGADVKIETQLVTNESKSGTGCNISGKIDSSGSADGTAIKIDTDFEGKLMYAAWEKNPGSWLVSTEGLDNLDSDWALGVWYFESVGNKLRISQERWSYCYSGDDTYIDEVFTHAVTLVKLS